MPLGSGNIIKLPLMHFLLRLLKANLSQWLRWISSFLPRGSKYWMQIHRYQLAPTFLRGKGQWDYSNIDSPACKVAIPWCWTAVTCVLGSGNLTGMARELRKETHTYRTAGISGPGALMQMNQRQPRKSVCLFSMSEQGNSRRSL